MKKRLTVLVACLVAIIGLAACSSNSKSEEPKYADDTAMETVQKGFEARAELIDQMEQAGKDTETTKAYKKCVAAELDVDKPLKDSKFKSSKMQQDVLAYINSLEGQKEVLENSSMSSDNFWTDWNKAYNTRCEALKTLVDKYDLKVSDKYKDDFDDLVNNGKAVAKKNEADEQLNNLFSGITFDKQGDGYDNTYWTYSAIVENTTSNTYSNVTLTLALYDADGVRQGETYASINTWAAGEKVRVEATSEIDATTVKVEPTYYDVK